MTMTDGTFWPGRNILVTGAGGFVGAHLAAALVSAGAEVVAVVRDQPPLSGLELQGVAGQVTVIRGSITDAAVVARAINEYEVDTVFHLAAQAMVIPANREPVSTFESNIQGTWTVLEACRLSPLVGRVVVASSDKAYGAQPSLPYTETMPLLATNPYDVSKACADMLARSYHRVYDLPVVVSRCANIYGGGDTNYSRLVPGTIRSALQGERPVVRSDGTPLRDYIHVDDAVEAYLTLAEQALEPEVVGTAFNFGANKPVAVLDLVQTVLSACGREDLEPVIQARGKLRMEIDQQYLDSSRAERELGWRARTGLAEGIARTVDWYRDQVARIDGSLAPHSPVPGRELS
jgi:CDP-glucose 4,6-dehydratase